MFKELTEELLDLTANMQAYRNAYLAQTRRPGSLCCSCSCCTVVAQ
jgi:streptolysin S family bacteriocin protoxin